MTRYAITETTVLDGSGRTATRQTVVWEEDTFEYVGAEPPADNDLVVLATGGTVLPGLIDAHVHISVAPDLSGVDDVATEPVARTAIRAAQNARILLDSGITSARDVGSRAGVAIDVAAAQAAGDLRAARIVASGRGITSLGGHGMTLSVEVDGPAQARQAVITEIERGAQVIKTFPTGGVLGPGARGFAVVMTPEEMSAAVEAAHEYDVKVAAHAHGAPGVEMVLDAGVDTVEHGTAATAEQVARMAAEGVALVPTLLPLAALQRTAEPIPQDIQERAAEVRAVQSATVAAAIEAGVTVLPGTDAGTPFNPVGNLVAEMELLAELGLGNAGVIAAATSQAATVVGLEGRGVIAPGAPADLVLVAGDPTEDLSVLRCPSVIVQDGIVHR